jgi:hypothetical protein
MENMPEDHRGKLPYWEFEDAETGARGIKRVGYTPGLARACLAKLREIGLHTKWPSEDDELYSVRLKESGQSFWLEFGNNRDYGGMPTIEVMGESQQQDIAILSALTNVEARPIDLERLRNEVLPQIRALLESGKCTSVSDAFARKGIGLPEIEEPEEFNQLPDYCFRLLRPKDIYILGLLQEFRPDFDSYPYEVQIALLEETCKRTNELLRASRHLVNFLEYGAPNRDTRAEVENVARDVRAAKLRDVGGLSYKKIGEVLGVSPPSTTNREKNDHSTIRAMVKRGRKILEEALGEEGWQEKAEAMRSETKELIEQRIETCAVLNSCVLDLSVDEVRSHVVLNPATGLAQLDEEYGEKLGQKLRERYGEAKPKDQL